MILCDFAIRTLFSLAAAIARDLMIYAESELFKADMLAFWRRTLGAM
jgi:hypothetical protein